MSTQATSFSPAQKVPLPEDTRLAESAVHMHSHHEKQAQPPSPLRIAPSVLRFSVGVRLAIAALLLLPLWIAVVLVMR